MARKKALHAIHKAAPRARLTGEAIAAFFVALETHFLIFSLILVAWLILDLLELFTDPRV